MVVQICRMGRSSRSDIWKIWKIRQVRKIGQVDVKNLKAPPPFNFHSCKSILEVMPCTWEIFGIKNQETHFKVESFIGSFEETGSQEHI